jgi:hypothetical protein
MFLSLFYLEKKMKNTTDTKTKFLKNYFSYIFGSHYDEKQYEKLQPTKFSLYYCCCKEEYKFENEINGNKFLFSPNDECKSCGKIIKEEDRVEVFSIIEQIFSLINRPHVKKLLCKKREEINNKIKENFNDDTQLTDTTNSFLYRFYFQNGVFNIDVNGIVFSVGIFIDSAKTMKHSKKGKINGSSFCINELPEEFRFLPEYTATFITFVERYPMHNSILKPMVTLLQFSYYNGWKFNDQIIRIFYILFLIETLMDSSLICKNIMDLMDAPKYYSFFNF